MDWKTKSDYKRYYLTNVAVFLSVILKGALVTTEASLKLHPTSVIKASLKLNVPKPAAKA